MDLEQEVFLYNGGKSRLGLNLDLRLFFFFLVRESHCEKQQIDQEMEHYLFTDRLFYL